MKKTGTAMLTIGWLLLAGMIWWGFEQYLNPNARLDATLINGDVVLERGPDGHFRAPGAINGKTVEFLVDTGATVVAIPGTLADRLALTRGPAQQVHTANGTAAAYPTRLSRINLGGATASNVSAHIVPGMGGDQVLLGMSFLARFDISMNRDELRIRAR